MAQLTQAVLEPYDGNSPIIFMFNPASLTFQEKINTQENPGANNTETGRPKVSFANKQASTIIINDVIFDTYEEGADVVARYISRFKEAMTFVQGSPVRRTPVYRFVWGTNMYFRRCFVETLDYKLTKFLDDGTPVRAVIDNFVLKESDEPGAQGSGSMGATNPNQATRINSGQNANLFNSNNDPLRLV